MFSLISLKQATEIRGRDREELNSVYAWCTVSEECALIQAITQTVAKMPSVMFVYPNSEGGFIDGKVKIQRRAYHDLLHLYCNMRKLLAEKVVV